MPVAVLAALPRTGLASAASALVDRIVDRPGIRQQSCRSFSGLQPQLGGGDLRHAAVLEGACVSPGTCAAAPLRVTLSQLPALRLTGHSAIMRDMGLGIAPIIHGDNAES